MCLDIIKIEIGGNCNTYSFQRKMVVILYRKKNDENIHKTIINIKSDLSISLPFYIL